MNMLIARHELTGLISGMNTSVSKLDLLLTQTIIRLLLPMNGDNTLMEVFRLMYMAISQRKWWKTLSSRMVGQFLQLMKNS